MREVYKSIETDIEINVFFKGDEDIENKSIALVFNDESGHSHVVNYYPNDNERSPFAKYIGNVEQVSTGTVRPAIRVLIPKGSFFHTGKLYYYSKERFPTDYYRQKEIVDSDYIRVYTGIRLINEAYKTLPILTEDVNTSSSTVEAIETDAPRRTPVELEVDRRYAGAGDTKDSKFLAHTLTPENWIEKSAELFEYVISDHDVTDHSWINLLIEDVHVQTARDSGIYDNGTFNSGEMHLFCKIRPTTNIDISYYLEDSVNTDGIDMFPIRNLDYSYKEIDVKIGEIRNIIQTTNGEGY